ncbi:MAG: DUF5667 domain-containing protein [Candidatus Magasanikbacteria bacterium]|nr:DUF5667 domain-containing protein [Candidatus Magasanikbacteria bacterium]
MKRADVVQSIRMLKNTAHAANPNEEWVASSRAQMLSTINRTTEEVPTRIFTMAHVWSALSLIMPQKTVYAYVRPAVIFTLCFSLGTAGWITTVSASLGSLPGDALYPVKIATEHTQVAVVQVTQGSAATAELHLSFASRRADEVTKIIATPTANPVEQKARVAVAAENLKTEVQNVSETLQAAKQSDPAAAVQVAKVIEVKITALQQSLDETAADGSVSSTVSGTGAVVALAQLKQETDSLKQSASSTAATSTAPNATSTPSTIPAPTTSTLEITVPATSTVVIFVPAAQKAPEVKNTEPVISNQFPERPAELAPNVVRFVQYNDPYPR